ncbi:membrane binding-domain-containing protein [Xylaria castorea]|nr:membrane binding-domain-containing protein [Xylaria castorea]
MDNNPPGNVAADFYEKLNYGGKLTTYSINETHDFSPKTIVDLYQSVKVGTAVRVFCWNEPDTDGSYREVGGNLPDLKGLNFNSLSVDDVDTHIVSFKFVDKTSDNRGDYSLTVQLHNSDQRILISNEGDYYKIAGKFKASDGDITTAVSVRNVQTGVYPATGSIHFEWNNDTEKVDIESEDDWPKQLEHKQDGPAKFTITLVSDKP